MHTASTTQPQSSATAQLLRLVLSLNPEANTIGAGMLAQLQALAQAAQASTPGDAAAAPDATAITATPTQIAEAFTAWETGYRLDPASYLTADEARALELDDYGQRCGAYFTGLLRAMQGSAA